MKKRTKKEMLMLYFTYLDDLRESGITNMYGASPYLAEEFGLGEAEARAILIEWVRTFSTRHEDNKRRSALKVSP